MEAIKIIEHLKKTQNKSIKLLRNERGEEDPTMTKNLQEIRAIKIAITITQDLSRTQVRSWANVLSKPKVAITIIKM